MEKFKKAKDFSSLGECLYYLKEKHHLYLEACCCLADAATCYFSEYREGEPENWHRLLLYIGYLKFLREGSQLLFERAMRYSAGSQYKDFKFLRAEATSFMGIYWQSMGDPGNAMGFYRRALKLRKTIGPRESLLKLHITIGTCHRDLREFSQARSLLRSLYEGLTNEKRHVRLYLCATLELARVERADGEPKEAAKLLDIATSHSQVSHYPNIYGDCLRELMRVSLDFGEAGTAQKFYDQALFIYQQGSLGRHIKFLQAEFAERVRRGK